MNLIITRASKTTSGVLTNGLSRLNGFACSGTLTGLLLGVDVRTESGTHDLYPKVSLQRPTDIDESGVINYEIVSGSERSVRLTPANFSTSGVFNYPLDPPLEFQENDVLVWNQPDPEKSVVRMYAVNGTGLQAGAESLLIHPFTGEVYSSECSSFSS